MVLELKVPRGTDVKALLLLVSVFLSYVLSFVFLGATTIICFRLSNTSTAVCCGRICICCSGYRSFPLSRPGWARINLPNGRSLSTGDAVSNFTQWAGRQLDRGSRWVLVMLGAAIAYFILTRSLIALHGRESVLATAVGRDFKGKISVVIYISAIALSFANSWLAGVLYVLVALMWLIPDRRIEKNIS